MKTRANLKRELNESIPYGEEMNFLNQTDQALTHSRKELQELRDERVRIKRLISIRERKFQDWKGKVPRARGAEPLLGDARNELHRLGDMPCHCVATLQAQGRELHFTKDFVRALVGVGGFEKIWVLMLVPDGLSFETGQCLSKGDTVGCETGQAAISAVYSFYLHLVDVVSCDVGNGVVKVRGLAFHGNAELLKNVVVLDTKPYLSYCEAWPKKVV